MLKHLCIAAFALLIQLPASAQMRLLLQDGTYKTEKETSFDWNREHYSFDQATQKFYGIAQFESMPTQDDLEAFAKYGIEFGHSIPINGYVITVPAASVLKLQNHKAFFSFTPIPAKSRMSARMLNKDFPEWMWASKDIAKIDIHLHMDSDYGYWKKRIERETGFRIVKEDIGIGMLSVEGSLYGMDALMKMPIVEFVQEADEPGQPENFNSRTNARVHAAQRNGQFPYTGENVIVALGDDGSIGPHIDYQGRILLNKAGASIGDHGDHVAGTIFGAGNRDPRGMGMAPAAEMVYYDYPDNIGDIDQDYSLYGILITSSSYSNGCNAGYTSFTSTVDNDSRQHRSLLHVFSAGNTGTSDCGYGAGSGWGNITGGHKAGKNVVTVANLTTNDVIATSSSRGPTADGRIKPDVGAVGTDVYSTIDPHTYGFKTGTSMSCPGVSGTLSVLYDAYMKNNANAKPEGGLMKAILMNTCEDLGNPGPDFIYGYGRVNALYAIEAIENTHYTSDSITNGQTKTFSITVPDQTKELKAMVYWVDPSGSLLASRKLVNDLDVTLTAPNGTVYQPWVLNPNSTVANLSANAVRAVDSLNNTEQITLLDPAAGIYTVSVNASSIPFGGQEYFITWQFVKNEMSFAWPVGGESVVPFQPEVIRWHAPAGTTPFSVEMSLNGGTSWITLNNNVSANSRLYNWNSPPSATIGNALIRVSRNGQSIVSNPFNIIAMPNNLSVDYICPDSIGLSWTASPGATGYDLFVLGARYMDSVSTTSTNSGVILGLNPQEDHWFSVRARNGSIVGQRADAIFQVGGTFGCILENDLGVNALLSPVNGTPECQISNIIPAIEIGNYGVDTAYNFQIHYSLFAQGGFSSTQTYTVTDSLLPGQIAAIPFPAAATLNSGMYTGWATVTYAGDQNRFNDSLDLTINILNSSAPVAFPSTEDFDLFNNCATATNCASTICPLPGNWENLQNGSSDDIDWRVNSGTTPSANTGPSSDHTPGSINGKYLYLEASDCFLQEAILLSPCVDLTGTLNPKLEFWYHMYGAGMGELHIDVIANGQIIEDIMIPLTGDKGNQWLQASADLTNWVGQTITIRVRGITGGAFTSDMAIDDFKFVENSSAPSALFSSNETSSCLNSPVSLNDNSSNSPNQWEWKIFPTSFQFINGTSATSQNPVVSFTQYGTYTVRLITANQFGTDSIELNNYIDVSPGDAIAVAEDFDLYAPAFPPPSYQLVNPDGDMTWMLTSAVGLNGSNSRVVRINNFSYNAVGEEDWLITGKVEIPATGNTQLLFDVAYAEYSASFSDAMEVRVSTDCGLTYSNIVYSKAGPNLSSVSNYVTSSFTPTQTEWRTDTIDLNAFAGQNISASFVAINGYGNNLFIDNIRFVDPSVTGPTTAQISTNPSQPCVGQPYIIEVSNPQAGVNYEWDFSALASPSVVTGPGPHTIQFSATGSSTMKLRSFNTGGSNSLLNVLSVSESPTVAFNSTPSFIQRQFNFSNQSTGAPFGFVQWHFGDGNTSSQNNPTYQYAAPGTYMVSLVVENGCGRDSSSQQLVISGIGIGEDESVSWLVYPNPTNNLLHLAVPTGKQVSRVRILDLRGQEILNQEVEEGLKVVQIELLSLATGTYLFEWISDDQPYQRLIRVNQGKK
jgi:PKD repeat protein